MGPTGPSGTITTDILGGADGPFATIADLWVAGAICERCFTNPPLDDNLCAECIDALVEASLTSASP